MTKKKEAALFHCLHCTKEFRIQVRWCASCDDHMRTMMFKNDDSICMRCKSGENDRWLASREARKAKAVAFDARIEEVKAYWDNPTRDRGELVAAHEAWCGSPEYQERFFKGRRYNP